MAPEWMREALCAQIDPELFYGYTEWEGQASRGSSWAALLAKKICRQCPVRQPCLQLAMDNNERFGVWGGHTPKERASLRSARAS